MSKEESTEKVVAPAGPTPGAGVDPKKVVKPVKRLKKLYRTEAPKASFKVWARGLAADGDKYAEAWLMNKTHVARAVARASRRDRVKTGRALVQSRPGHR
jgi:hypothetical protein